MAFQIVTVGNAPLDALLTIRPTDSRVRIDKQTGELCIKAGEKILVEESRFSLGGGACHVAVGTARLGLTSAIFAEVGTDAFSERILHDLAHEHVDIGYIVRGPGQSSFTVGITFQSERTLFPYFVPGTHHFSFESLETDWLYLASLGEEWQNAYANALSFVKAKKRKLAFAPGTTQLLAGKDAIADILEFSNIIFINKQEAEMLVGKYEDIKTLLAKVSLLGPKNVVITDGRKGSYVLDSTGENYFCDIYTCDVVEKTGAGDAYAAGFIGAMLHDLPISTAMQWGTLNAASVMGVVGAQEGLLHHMEIETMQQKKDVPIPKKL